MKKEIIKDFKRIVLSTIVLSLLVTPIVALADPTANHSAGTNVEEGSSSTVTPCNNAPVSPNKICWDRQADGNNVGGLNAMRATLVKSDGTRVEGTVSIDLVGAEAVGAAGVADFQEFTIIHDNTHPWNGIGSLPAPSGSTNINGETGKGITIMSYGGAKGDKNEFVAAMNDGSASQKVTRVTDFSQIKTYKWSSISKYVYESKNVRSIVSTIYHNDFGSIKKILNLMNYDLPDEPNEPMEYNTYYDRIKDYYLLLEPVVYVQETYGSTRHGATVFAVYGTVTEVKYIINNYFNIPISTPIENNFWTEIYSASQRILVGQTVRDGVMQDTTAGLRYTTTTNQVAALTELTAGYIGQGAGHFWLRGSCTDPCSCGEVCVPTGDMGTCALSGLEIDLADCNGGKTNGLVKDTEDWKCILRQANADKNTYEGQFYVNLQIAESEQADATMVTNNYCNIACRETISYYLPNNLYQKFDAGYRFSIGENNFELTGIPDLSPVTFTGVKECKTALPPSYLATLNASGKVLTNSGEENGVTDEKVLNNSYIDVDRFKREYIAANNAVISAWDNYQIALLPQRASANANTKKANNDGGTTSSPSQCSSDDSWSITGHAYDKTTGRDYGTFDPHITCTVSNPDPVCTNTANGGTYTTYDDQNNRRNVYSGNRGVTTHTITSYSATASYTKYNGQTITSGTKTATKASCGTASHGSDASVTPEEQVAINTAYEAYTDAVAYRDLLLKQIEQCSNYIDEYNEFDPQVNFAYRDYSYMTFFTLKRTTSYTSHPIYYENNLSTGKTTTSETALIDRADCNGNEACKSGLKTKWENGVQVVEYDNRSIYPINKKMESTKEIVYKYSTPNSSSYQYRSIDGKMFKTEAAAIANGIEYTIYGESTLPVSFDNGTGQQCYKWYEEWQSTYSIGLGRSAWSPEGRLDWIMDFYYDTAKEVNLFGKNQKYNKYRDIITVNGLKPFNDSLYSIFSTGQVAGTNFGYLCIEDETITGRRKNVRNCVKGCCEEICNPKISCEGGLNVIYRPISLFNAFPGIAGTGRTPGSNWNNYIQDGANYITFEEKYITNNRGVKTNQVYTLTPMYEFTLSPYNIGQIRAYNDNQKNNYMDLETLTCDDDNTHCKSSFLANGIDKGYFGFTTNSGGTCMTNIDGWEACR